MFPYLLAIPFIAHGLANLAGVFAPWTKSLSGFSDVAWAFPGGTSYSSWAGRAFSPLWLVSTLCLLAAGVGIFRHQQSWPWLAILGCSFSAVAILPWWKAVPPGARSGAIFDLIVILLLISPLRNTIVEQLTH